MPMPTSDVLNRLRWVGRAARLALEDPVEGLDRALLRVVRRRQALGSNLGAPDQAWERHLHALVGAPWPCPFSVDVEGLFYGTMDQLTAQGLTVGWGGL